MAKKKNKNKKLLNILLIELFFVAILFIAYKFFDTMNKIDRNDKEDGQIEVNDELELEGYRNIALFGVDSRNNDLNKDTHADTIMIASINNKTKAVKLISIYRDTYVNIPSDGFDKVNHSFFQGGYSLALSTINTNLDLDIREYITVNFKALVNAIDAIGGIELDIQDNEIKYLNGYVRELNKINKTKVKGLKQTGLQTVNGTQATAYARIRYTSGGDYKRTERQRTVLTKMFDKAKQSDLSTLTTLIDDILPQISTNLTTLEILDLAKDILSYNIVEQTGFPFEPDAHKYQGTSYVFPINLEDNVSKLHETLFDELEYTPSLRVRDYSTQIEAIRIQK